MFSYSPAVGYEPLDAGTAHVVLFADSDAERRAELAEAFTEVLAGLDKVDEDELPRRGERRVLGPPGASSWPATPPNTPAITGA